MKMNTQCDQRTKGVRAGRILLALLLYTAAPSSAQEQPPHDHSKMAGHEGMNMPGMDHGDMNGAGTYLMNMAAGTSMNPLSTQMPMLLPRLGSWNLMVMGQAFLVDTEQSGTRGADNLWSSNWGMT